METPPSIPPLKRSPDEIFDEGGNPLFEIHCDPNFEETLALQCMKEGYAALPRGIDKQDMNIQWGNNAIVVMEIPSCSYVVFKFLAASTDMNKIYARQSISAKSLDETQIPIDTSSLLKTLEVTMSNNRPSFLVKTWAWIKASEPSDDTQCFYVIQEKLTALEHIHIQYKPDPSESSEAVDKLIQELHAHLENGAINVAGKRIVDLTPENILARTKPGGFELVIADLDNCLGDSIEMTGITLETIEKLRTQIKEKMKPPASASSPPRSPPSEKYNFVQLHPEIAKQKATDAGIGEPSDARRKKLRKINNL